MSGGPDTPRAAGAPAPGAPGSGLHPLLECQLRHARGAGPADGPGWDRLCALVDAAYREADTQRRLVERTLALMSEDLHARNRELSRQLDAVAEQARVLENLHDAALVLAQDGRVIDCYAATEQLLGLPRDRILGRSFWDLVGRPGPHAVPEAVQARMRAEGRWSGELAFRRRDGSEGLLATTLISFPPSAQLAGRMLAVAEDVTDRRRVERQLFQSQKLEGIGQLAAGVAHEINTPAQYVADNLRFLEDAFQQLAPAARGQAAPDESVEVLLAEVPGAITQSLEGMNRIAEIVRGIKLFAHPGTGEKTILDLNREIETTIAVSRNEWKYVAEVIADLDPNLPPVPGFPGEIGHVFLNLIVNAAHAIGESTGNGSERRGRITVSTRRAGDSVEVRIADDGPGIPPEIQSRVFDPFFTTKPVGKGTGQGLAISHRIVHEKHGGSLGFQSAAGKGTTFVVSLPLNGTQDGEAEEPLTGTEGP